MSHVSLTRKWILLSLVLLSPDILAAESLNFNYKRVDTLSLEPRLGVQARACHSKADPMDIMFRIDKGINITKPYKVMLSISGEAYAKNYAVFTSSAKTGGNIGSDFLVPWSAYAKGAAKVNESNSASIPAVPAKNSQPFCFSGSSPYYYSIIYPPSYSVAGLIPIFKDSPYYADPLGYLTAADFEKICQRTLERWESSTNPDAVDGVNSARYYWPSGVDLWEHRLVKYTEISRMTGSSFIESRIKQYGKYALQIEQSPVIFFTKRTEYQPPRTEIHTVIKNNNMDENCTTSNCNFTFLTGEGNHGNFIQDGGSFLVRLNNRNVTSLTLTLVYDKETYTWNWQREQDSSSLTSNRLYLVNSTEGRGTVLPKIIDADDPYKSFYKNGDQNFYLGTLVTAGSLNMGTYNDYIKNVIPLSIPSSKAGDINLVNTESLTFSLGAGSNGAPTLGIFGQPLKFAPIIVNGKNAASAMQVRNACY